MQELYGNQFIVAMLGAWVIEYLKQSSWFSFITIKTEELNKIFAGVVAALSTAGILVVTSWDATTSTFVFSVTHLTMGNISSFLWHGLGQYLLMKLIYKVAIKPPVLASELPTSTK